MAVNCGPDDLSVSRWPRSKHAHHTDVVAGGNFGSL